MKAIPAIFILSVIFFTAHVNANAAETVIATCHVLGNGVTNESQSIEVADRGTLGRLRFGSFSVDVVGVRNEQTRIHLIDNSTDIEAVGQIDSVSGKGLVQMFKPNGEMKSVTSVFCELTKN